MYIMLYHLDMLFLLLVDDLPFFLVKILNITWKVISWKSFFFNPFMTEVPII